MSVGHVLRPVVPGGSVEQPKEADQLSALSKFIKFIHSMRKNKGISTETTEFLKSVSDNLGAIPTVQKVLFEGPPKSVYDGLGRIGSFKSLCDIIGNNLKGIVESEVYALWKASDSSIGTTTFACFKKLVSDMQSAAKDASESLSGISKTVSVVSIDGHLDKIIKASDVFIHPEEHAGETQEAGMSLASGFLGIASFALSFFSGVPASVTNGLGVLSALTGLAEAGNKNMLPKHDLNKRVAKDAIRKDFAKLERVNKEQTYSYRKGNFDHEYNKQFRVFEKGGTAKDFHDQQVEFQGVQAFFTQIESAESSAEIAAILDTYLSERSQLSMPHDMIESEAAIKKMSQKLAGSRS